MKDSRNIRAVVFDLDGLLIDSEPLQLAAWDQYLERFGARLSPELLGRMLGLRLVDSAVVVVNELGLPVTPDEVVHERDAIFLASVPGAVRAMPGAPGLIDALRQKGFPLALATSGHRRYVDLALASAGLGGSFEVEVTGELVARGKPAPDVYLRCAVELGLEPSDCLALEDAPNGVRSAISAGMVCFAIPNHDTRGLDFSAASAVVPGLDEVLPEMIRRGLLAG